FCFICRRISIVWFFFFFQAEDGIRDGHVTGVQTCALPIFACTHGRSFQNHASRRSARPARWRAPHCAQSRLRGTSGRPVRRGARSEERRVGKECRGGRGGDR